jgi:hypothetical protein
MPRRSGGAVSLGFVHQNVALKRRYGAFCHWHQLQNWFAVPGYRDFLACGDASRHRRKVVNYFTGSHGCHKAATVTILPKIMLKIVIQAANLGETERPALRGLSLLLGILKRRKAG